MENENSKVFMSEVDKNELIKKLRSKVKLGIYGKGFLHGTVFIGFFFLAMYLGSTASARPAALDMAEQNNSHFYQQMDVLKGKIQRVDRIMGEIETMADQIKSDAHKVNKYIRSEEMILPEEAKQAAPEPVTVIPEAKVTTYNAEVGQTDSTPCYAGGTRLDICLLHDRGYRPLAVSQDLAKWSMIGDDFDAPFAAGDVVYLESTNFPEDPRCNGQFVVADAMNIRFRKKADIFMPERGSNISCEANIVFRGENISHLIAWANIDRK